MQDYAGLSEKIYFHNILYISLLHFFIQNIVVSLHSQSSNSINLIKVDFMVEKNQEKHFTAVSFNESLLVYVRLSLKEMEVFFPKYVIRRLLCETEYKGQPDNKFGKFSFTRIILHSEECLAVELTFDQFNHFFSGGSVKVYTKTRKTTLAIIYNSSETPLMVSEPNVNPIMEVVQPSTDTDKTSTDFTTSTTYRSTLTVSKHYDIYPSISYLSIDIFPVRSYLITIA